MSISHASEIQRLREEVGDLLSRHDSARDLSSFAPYRDDPVGFIRDVLRGDPWARQEEIAGLVRDHELVAVRSCNGAGKDWLAAQLALWWVYARRGFVLVTGPTERQVKVVVMGEIRRAFGKARQLPGSLFELALKLDTTEQAGILAFTSNDASKLTGFHAPALLVIVTEAQGVEAYTWEGVLACATGEESRVLAVANPLHNHGRFFDICRAPHWRSVKISALEHPNVLEQRSVIPGAVTQAFIDRTAQEYGEGSGVFRSRVLAEFPDEAEDTLCRRAWLEAAAKRWAEWPLETKCTGTPLVAAIDPARYGADSTVMAMRRGSVVLPLVTWCKADTMETVGRIIVELEERGIAKRCTRGRTQPDGRWGYETVTEMMGRVVVDEIGVGGGVLDRLKEQEYRAEGFCSAGSPSPAFAEKFANLRAEAFWGLRRLLEEGQLALPPDEKLFDELAGIQWRVNSAGKIQIEDKKEIRARLGRSPDRADAVAMACHGMWQEHRYRLPKQRAVRWGS